MSKVVSVFTIEKDESGLTSRGINYAIELEDNKIIARKAIYPIKDPEGRPYGNHYEYAYIINIYSRPWARLELYQFNHGFSPGLGGMNDSILLFRKPVKFSEVRPLIERIKDKIRKLKDGDPEIKNIVLDVEEFFNITIEEANIEDQ